MRFHVQPCSKKSAGSTLVAPTMLPWIQFFEVSCSFFGQLLHLISCWKAVTIVLLANPYLPCNMKCPDCDVWLHGTTLQFGFWEWCREGFTFYSSSSGVRWSYLSRGQGRLLSPLVFMTLITLWEPIKHPIMTVWSGTSLLVDENDGWMMTPWWVVVRLNSQILPPVVVHARDVSYRFTPSLHHDTNTNIHNFTVINKEIEFHAKRQSHSTSNYTEKIKIKIELF